MSYGKMNLTARLTETRNIKDSEGFPQKQDITLAVLRVYREGRHGSYKWANLAAFSDATDLFRFRRIEGVSVLPGQTLIVGGERLEIISVEDVKGRGMYTEVLARKVVPSGT